MENWYYGHNYVSQTSYKFYTPIITMAIEIQRLKFHSSLSLSDWKSI